MDGLKVRLLVDDERRELMKAPDDVSAMLRLKGLGWGSRRIAAELGCAQHSAALAGARGLAAVGVAVAVQEAGRICRSGCASGFLRHAGNADVVRQELAREKSVSVSLRTVERAVAPFRRELIAAARATVRFETEPGQQLQIDFGERRSRSAGCRTRCSCLWPRSATRAGCMCVGIGRAAGELVRRAGKCVPGVRWGASRGAARQRAGADPAP